MRRTLIAALAALGVGAIFLQGSGQRGAAQSPLSGGSPRALQFQPVSMSNMVGNLNTSNMMHTPKPPSPLGMGNILKMPTLPTWPPKLASTPQINPSKNPFQPNAPKGKYVINPTAPGPGSKSNWNFPYNPLAKRTTKKTKK